MMSASGSDCIAPRDTARMGRLEEGQKAADAPVSILDVVERTEAKLEYPLGDIWRTFRDMRRWYTEYTLEVITGPAYDPGVGLHERQLLRVQPLQGFPRAPGADGATEAEYFLV